MSTPNEREEISIEQLIFQCVDSFNSFRFNAGAGAGKTYALVETIRHILRKKRDSLRSNKQQVICITYTNVAVKEIRERLGLSDIVITSTIHEYLWGLIKLYQKELIEIHQDRLELEIQSISSDLSDILNSKYMKYASLDEQSQLELESFVLENKDVFYQNRDARAADFKIAYSSFGGEKPSSIVDL